MSKVDWSLAPEGATHYCVEGAYSGLWRDLRGSTWLWFSEKTNSWQDSSERTSALIHNSVGIVLVARPKQWSGPQDGLPPVEWRAVGEMVQVMSLPTHHHEDVSIYLSKPSKIVASYTDDDGDTFLMLRIDCDFGTGYECFAAHRVLPAKTEKQIAAEQRETAIADMAKVLPGAKHECWTCNPDGSVKPYENTYEILGLLVDAGFKREVV